jgi:hypothetical protein
MPLGATGATAKGAFSTRTTEKDPYQYQVGFGNLFASEAIPGVLPEGQNSPQKCKYDLYNEGVSKSAWSAQARSVKSTLIDIFCVHIIDDRRIFCCPSRGERQELDLPY